MTNSILKISMLLLGLIAGRPGLAQDRALPNDSSVVSGRLKNGFHYYIKRNLQPAGRATIYLVTRAGSILETEHERGIAHFIEHMNFNGTRHFPKNELISYLERAGVKFGADLNAYTAFNETVYQLPLPTDDAKLWKNGLLIMHDWADGATLSETDYNSERGIILEEKRMRRSAEERLQEQFRRQLFSNSRYAIRMPIGTEEVIRNSPVNVAREFYKRWYRPDLQALIVAGDIDPLKVRQEIIRMFSDLKPAAKPVARRAYPVRLQDSATFVKLGDPEYGRYTIEWYYKFLRQPLRTEKQFGDRLLEGMIRRLLSARFNEVADRERPAYTAAGGGISSVVENMAAIRFQLLLNPEKIEAGIRAYLTEVERLRRFGFTADEVSRMKEQVQNSAKYRLAEQDKTNSADFAGEYLDHFLNGTHYLDIKQEEALTIRSLSTISAEKINRRFRDLLNSRDLCTIVLGPEAGLKNLPDKEQLSQWQREISALDLQPYRSVTVGRTLLPDLPSPGKLIAETKPDSAGIIKWTLANGATVYAKATSFKNDEVLFSAFRSGGSAVYSLNDSYSAKNATAFITSSGVDKYSASQLSQMLNGKALQVRPYIADRYEGFRGASSARDLSSALALTNLYMTRPRLDTALFSQIIAQSKAAFRNRGADPARDLTDTITAVSSGYHPRRRPTALADFDKIDSAKVLAAFKERLGNPAGLTFIFVGNFNPDTLKMLVSTYIGSIPPGKAPTPAPDLGIRVPEGQVRKALKGGKDNKASVQLVLSGKFVYNADNLLYLDLLRAALEFRLLSRLREKDGGIYSPSILVTPTKDPANFYAFTIAFQCDPARMDYLISATREEIASLARSGVTEDELRKFTAEERRSHELDVKNNGYWLQYIQQQLTDGAPLTTALKYQDMLLKLNVNVSQVKAAEWLSGKNALLFTQAP